MHLPGSPSAPAREVWQTDYRHVANHLVSVVLTAALGAAPLLCDPARFSSPSYASLRAAGGMTFWSVVLVVGGLWLLAAMAGAVRGVRWALLATGVVHAFLAVTFVLAQTANDGASPWGWMLFGGLAARHAMQALWFPARPA